MLATALVALAALMSTLPSNAAGGGGGGGGGGDGMGTPAPEYLQAVVAIKAMNWSEAIALLEPYVRRTRNDADGHNWLAYAYRKSGQLDLAFTHYKRALAIDPMHRGAHEYIGEAYLMVGDRQRAEFHLGELARLCASNCEEYSDLKQAIAAYQQPGTTAARTP
jgi:tetratricopeptide (TPR) repeat protein